MKVNELFEGTWAVPRTAKAVDALMLAMSKPLTASEAMENLSSVMGDDDFFDDLEAAQRKKVKDVRPIIKKHLKRLVGEMNDWNVKPSRTIRDELELLLLVK